MRVGPFHTHRSTCKTSLFCRYVQPFQKTISTCEKNRLKNNRTKKVKVHWIAKANQPLLENLWLKQTGTYKKETTTPLKLTLENTSM